jgi:uncharacterized Ntn-hydrolase superfamily protein
LTYAIAARCAETGRLGVAITTRALCVSSRCPFIEPGVGLVVTMARTDPRLGPLGINLLKLGYSAQRTLDEIAASDPGIEHRQVCVIDRDGHSAARTGDFNKQWKGALVEKNVVAMGNNLTSERTALAMRDTLLAATDKPLEERLLLALEAGRDAGGQNGGQRSAGLHVYDREIYAYVDLRVDAHEEPVQALRALYELHKPLIPYYYGRPGQPDEYGREEEWLARKNAG